MLRAQNLTRNAIRGAQRDLTKLERQQLRMRAAAQQMTQAGLLQSLMFVGMGAALVFLASKTRWGNRIMRSFNRTLKRFTDVFGKEFLLAIRPMLTSLEGLMKMFLKNRKAMQVVIRAILSLLILGTLHALVKIGIGLWQTYQFRLDMASISFVKTRFAMVGLTKAVAIQSIHWTNLGRAIWAALGPAMLIATIITTLMPIFGRLGTILIALTAIILGLALAKQILLKGVVGAAEFGVALAIGGGMAAAFTAAMPEMPSFQRGARFVRKTGPAIVHEGEQVIPSGDIERARRMREAMERAEITQAPQPVNIEVSIARLQTQAEEEELKDVIWKATKRALDDAEFGD